MKLISLCVCFRSDDNPDVIPDVLQTHIGGSVLDIYYYVEFTSVQSQRVRHRRSMDVTTNNGVAVITVYFYLPFELNFFKT